VGFLRVEDEEAKRTNEIKTTIPLLDAIDIAGKDITADALLTQRDIARYLRRRHAHYHFTVKGNQPRLMKDVAFSFQYRKEPDFVDYGSFDHGRIEVRKIWTTTELNDYLDFPHVEQAFVIERQTVEKKTGKTTHETAYGITSRRPEEASPERLLTINRRHWTIESLHYMLDWNYDEDRSRIRTGYGPENITRLRRFAIGLIKSKGIRSVAQKMRELTLNVRLVFDYLRMTGNTCMVKT
jgi:predicted transposase YbfD/YdcC